MTALKWKAAIFFFGLSFFAFLCLSPSSAFPQNINIDPCVATLGLDGGECGGWTMDNSFDCMYEENSILRVIKFLDNNSFQYRSVLEFNLPTEVRNSTVCSATLFLPNDSSYGHPLYDRVVLKGYNADCTAQLDDFENTDNTIVYFPAHTSGTDYYIDVTEFISTIKEAAETIGFNLVSNGSDGSLDVRIANTTERRSQLRVEYALKIFVDPDATGNNDGTSWTDAYVSLQDALNTAMAEDQIWVAAGTYYPDEGSSQTDNDRTSTFLIPSGVAVYGGFDGTDGAGGGALEITLDERDWENNPTILSGDLVQDDDSGGDNSENAYHVVWFDRAGSQTRLDGVTITAGNADGSLWNDKNGGGIYNNGSGSGNSSNPWLNNCTISGNNAFNAGGGIYNNGSDTTNLTADSSPTLTDCVISGNNAGSGGGIYNYGSYGNSSPVLTNCTINENNAGSGGGIYNNSSHGNSSPILLNCTVNGNTAEMGGGIHNQSDDTGTCMPELTGCAITNNSVLYEGGGIYNYGYDGTTSPILTDCTISGNSADMGGGFYNTSSDNGIVSPVLNNCTISGNAGAAFGGGMYNYSHAQGETSPALTNCAVINNTALVEGGGLGNYAHDSGASSPVLTNCTISGNTADNGGGIYNSGFEGIVSPALTNCILWGNHADLSGPEVYNDDGAPDYAYCDIKNSGGSTSWDTSLGTDSGNNIDADPLFAAPTAGNLRLTTGSPCLDTGNNIANSTSFDLDGAARIQNDIIDMGAYEGSDALPFANLIDWNGNLVADFGDNGLWYHDGASWHWMTNRGNVGQMVVWNGNLVVDFGADYGLQYYDGTNWNWMSNKGDVNAMIIWNNGSTEKLVVDFGEGRRVYTYNGAWSWFNNKDDVSGMTVWNNKLVVDFGNGRGIYNNDGAWHWMSNKDDIAKMVVWDNGSTERLVVDFGGGRRIYTYNGAWTWLTNKDDVNDMAVWNHKLVIDFGNGRRMYTYDGAWSWITNKDDVARMVAWNDGADKLAVDFGTGRGMYYYDGVWHWMSNKDDLTEMIAWGTRLAVDFGPGVGIYNYNGAWNFMKSWSTGD